MRRIKSPRLGIRLLSSQHLGDLSRHLAGQHRAGALVRLANSLAAGHTVLFFEPYMQFLGQMGGGFFIMQHQTQCNRPPRYSSTDTTRTGAASKTGGRADD